MTLLVPSGTDQQPAPQLGPPPDDGRNVLTDPTDPVESWFVRTMYEHPEDQSVPTKVGRAALAFGDLSYTGARDFFNRATDLMHGKYSFEDMKHLVPEIGVQTAMAGMGMGEFSPAEAGEIGMFRNWHGTPNLFDPTEANPLGEFRAEKMGSGEGAQVRGWGFYSAEAQGVGKSYRGAGRDVLPWTVSLDGEPIFNGGTGYGTGYHNRFFDLDEAGQYGMDALAGDMYEGLPQSITESAKALRAKATDRLNSIPDWPDYEEHLISDAQKYNAGADWLENNQDKIQFNKNQRGYLLDVLHRADKHEYLDLDAPIHEQDIGVQEKLAKLGYEAEDPEVTQRRDEYDSAAQHIFNTTGVGNKRYYPQLREKSDEGLLGIMKDNYNREGVSVDLGDYSPENIQSIRDSIDTFHEHEKWFNENPGKYYGGSPTGDEIYWELAQNRGPRGASEFLAENGIPGSKFWDQQSRDAKSGTRNYITFDPKDIWPMGRDGRQFFPDDHNPWGYAPPPERPPGSETDQVMVHRVGPTDGIFYGTHVDTSKASTVTSKRLPLSGPDVQTIHGTDHYGDTDNAPVADAVFDKLLPIDDDLQARLNRGINNNADMTWGADLAGLLQLKRNGIGVAHFPDATDPKRIVSVDLRHVDMKKLEEEFAKEMNEK